MIIKNLVAEAKAAIKEKVSKMTTVPSLAIVQLGDVPASNRYVKNKIKDCAEVGILVNHYPLRENISEESLISLIKTLNEDGIIVQLPLPGHIDPQVVAAAIPTEKDVDGFQHNSPFIPCTPGGIIWYLDQIKFPVERCNAVVIGRSDIVGKPMAKLLTDRNATVTLCHSRTPQEDLEYYLAHANLVICAVGKAGFLDPRLAPHALIVDVGINFDENGKLVGDVARVDGCLAHVTPVPGGVGLLTRLALLQNVVRASNDD